jgi:DNA repair protein RAD57
VLLTLLLSTQLAAPHGLSKSAVYISTESALSTSRLNQLLQLHPSLSRLPATSKPSLSRVLSIQVPDLESQEHILRYQLPVAIKRQNVGLVVIDSIAANYRAEFERPSAPENGASTPHQDRDSERRGAKSMAERKSRLVQLGAYLRNLARTENIAIVVANQVADRFSPVTGAPVSQPASAAGPSSSPTISPDPLTLDHQQRWFTGWGDVRDHSSNVNLKTPSLGLVWTNQIAARIALIKEPNSTVEGKRKRWFRVVFAPWCAPTEGRGIEYEIVAEGLRAVKPSDSGSKDE